MESRPSTLPTPAETYAPARPPITRISSYAAATPPRSVLTVLKLFGGVQIAVGPQYSVLYLLL